MASRRLRKSETLPEVWQAHRKLRKKIASAKWYAQKKQREIDEENRIRRQLEAKLQEEAEKRRHFVWFDPVQRAVWYGVMAHHSLGYPVRPTDADPLLWRGYIERIEQDIEDLREQAEAVHPTWGAWMRLTFVRKIFRQLAIRELQNHDDVFRTIEVPLGTTHPHRTGRLWTTSVWNWLWVMTHLGNHRESFPVVWAHLHRRALEYPLPVGGGEGWDLIRNDPDCFHWVCWMSQELGEHIEEPSSQTTDEENEEEEGVEPSQSSQEYVTQPDTPEWYLPYSDSDSESLPSSLDTFLNETFTHSATSD